MGPNSLYKIATKAVVENFAKNRDGLEQCPENVFFDVIYETYQGFHGLSEILMEEEVIQFPTFCKLLRIGDRRSRLHQMFQYCVDNSEKKVPQLLAQTFANEVDSLLSNLLSTRDNNLVQVASTRKTLELGFNLGGFLSEAGWYPAATTVYRACINILRMLDPKDPGYMMVKLECLAKLLHSLSINCQFSEASNIYTELTCFLRVEEISPAKFPALASIYLELSTYHHMKNNYQEAYTWAMDAVNLLSSDTPPHLTIDVLVQASKSSIGKYELSKEEGELSKVKAWVNQAVSLAKTVYGDDHPKYADCLDVYGRHLKNVKDETAVNVYQKSLDVRRRTFGGDNLQVAKSHHNLAGVIFSNKSDGSRNCSEVRRHAETSLRILSKHLPADHLGLARIKRLLALALTEIALDGPRDVGLLHRAEELHLSALCLHQVSLGEANFQTAECYYYLGHYYWSTDQPKKAERMLLKAIQIQIKETVVGPESYQVAESFCFLASVYEEMEEYSKAEQHLLRSVRIRKKLFGPSCFDLVLDYKDLLRIYELTGNHEKFLEYQELLEEGRRDQPDGDV